MCPRPLIGLFGVAWNRIVIEKSAIEKHGGISTPANLAVEPAYALLRGEVE